jgi:CRP-like cAMP-binding protein
VSPTRLLAGCELIRDALPETVRRLEEGSRPERVPERGALWRAGEGQARAVLIRRGLVQVMRVAPSGEEAMVGLFGPTELVGLTAALEDAPYPADAVAASPVEAVSIDGQTLREAVERDPAVARAVTRLLLAHNDALRAKIDVLTAGEIPDRLRTLLEYLARRFGDETADGARFIPLALPRRTLARLVGARVETVIRVMRRWEQRGLVRPGDDGALLLSRDFLLDGNVA